MDSKRQFTNMQMQEEISILSVEAIIHSILKLQFCITCCFGLFLACKTVFVINLASLLWSELQQFSQNNGHLCQIKVFVGTLVTSPTQTAIPEGHSASADPCNGAGEILVGLVIANYYQCR